MSQLAPDSRARHATVKSMTDNIALVERMRSRAGQDATMLTVRAKPQTDPRKSRL